MPSLFCSELSQRRGKLVTVLFNANSVPLVWSDYDEGTVKLLEVPID